MTKITRTQAETRYAAFERRQQTIMDEISEAAEIVRNKSAKLKALRLLRNAEDLQA